MRREFQPIGAIYHIYNKAARGLPFLYDLSDWWMVLRLLYYLNDNYFDINWQRDLWRSSTNVFERPDHWPERDPLIKIMDFCIHNDHYHLIVIQVREGGISEFMKRFPNSISRRLNEKYGGVGSVFQGPYQIRRVDEETDLRNLGLYVRVKNPFERYSYGGLEGAKKNFENAWKDMINDPFSSLPDYADVRNSPIIDKGMMGNLFSDSQKFKKEANEYLKNYERVDSGLEHLVIE